MSLTWKHVENKVYSDKDVGYANGKIRVFEIVIVHGILLGERAHYEMKPLVAGYKRDCYEGETLEDLKKLAEQLWSDWVKAAGLQEQVPSQLDLMEEVYHNFDTMTDDQFAEYLMNKISDLRKTKEMKSSTKKGAKTKANREV